MTNAGNRQRFGDVLFLTILAVMAIASFAPAAGPPKGDFHVAPDGRDAGPGSRERPFATFEAARSAVRKRIAAGLDRDVLVLIRGGTYERARTLVFGPEDSGTEKHGITYRAYPGETVVLSGGRRIRGWQRGPGKTWTVRLPEAKAGTWAFRQLFVNGVRAVRARFPNAGEKEPWCRIRSSDARPLDPGANRATYTIGVDRPIRAWSNVRDVELVWVYNNDGSRKRLGSVDEKAQTFTLPPPHQWPLRSLPGEYQIGYPLASHFCYLENAAEMLDEPGEWYLDRRGGVLTYWPRPGEDLQRAEVVAPVVERTLLAVVGTPDRPVRNLRFEGIHVAHVDWPLPPSGFTAMFGCLQLACREQPKPWARFHWIDAAVSFQYARSCHFTRGGVRHVGGIGLALLRGTSGNVVEGNHIHDLGGGGIVAGGIRNRDTLRWAHPIRKGDHKGYRIANNHVHDGGLDYFGAVGIFVGLAQEAVVEHNLIHDMAYAGIVLSGNEDKLLPLAGDNVVAHNHIHHVMKTAVDGAGIYVSFPQAGSGASIRGNWIHDLRPARFNSRNAGPWACPGIYLDGVRMHLGCKGYHFRGNVVYRCGRPLFLNQCRKEDNTWRENVFQKDAPSRRVLEAIGASAGPPKAPRRGPSEKPQRGARQAP